MKFFSNPKNNEDPMLILNFCSIYNYYNIFLIYYSEVLNNAFI